MSKALHSLISCGASAILITGCASTNPQKKFDELNAEIKNRTGESLTWDRDAKALSKADSLLPEASKTNLTIHAAVTTALRNNRRLQAEFESLGISQAELDQSIRLKNPEFSGSWRRALDGGPSINAEYEAAQDIFDLLLLPARKGIASRNVELTKQRIAESVLYLIAEVQKAFFTFQAAQQFRERMALMIEVNEASEDITQRQFDAGNINLLELETERTVLAQTRLEMAIANSEVRSARERLNRLLGLWGNATKWGIAEPLPALPAEEIALDEVEALAIGQRFDLAVARGEAELLASAIKLQKRFRFFPGSKVGFNAEHELDHSWVVGPSLDLEVPIFDQGQAEIARQAAEHRIALRRLEAMAIDIRSEVREARDTLIAARDAAEFHQKVLLPQRQRLLRETLLQYNAMQLSNQTLLATKEREQLAEKAAIGALRDYWIARVELAKQTGGSLGKIPTAPEASAPEKTEAEHSEHNH